MNDERGIECLGAWSDDGRYALCFLHGFACQRLTGWPNRLRLDVGGGRRPVKRRAKPTRSTAELTGSWRLFRSVLVTVESTGCQQHPQLAWPPTNSCSEPVSDFLSGNLDSSAAPLSHGSPGRWSAKRGRWRQPTHAALIRIIGS